MTVRVDARGAGAAADGAVAAPEPPPMRAPPGRAALRARLRLGGIFALAVSLALHSTLLALFVGGTAPGVADGQEAVPVEVVTQEQYDLLLGDGASRGGKPPRVEDDGVGAAPNVRTASPPAPSRAEADAERRAAPAIVSAPLALDRVPDGKAERVHAATSEAARDAEGKGSGPGSAREVAPARRTDPKERAEAGREDAGTASRPDPLRPGADGGAARRVASRGGVGDELGPLPPSMRQALMQLLQRQIEVCYEPPALASGTSELPLVVIRFNRDGSLDGVPRSQRFERTAGGRSLVKAALKAVRACAPYRLPTRFAPYYEDWREIRAEFEFSGR